MIGIDLQMLRVMKQLIAYLDCLINSLRPRLKMNAHGRKSAMAETEVILVISQQQLDWTESEESYREFIYKCSNDKDTIGIGYNLDAGMPHDLALIVLKYFMEANYKLLADNYPWFVNLQEGRKIAIADLCYQVGFTGFAKFKKSNAFMAIGDYDNAAHEFLDSKWARHDSPERAKRVTDMIRG